MVSRPTVPWAARRAWMTAGLGLAEQASRFVEQHTPCLGELDAPLRCASAAARRPRARGADLHAERRLRNVEAPRGAAEMQLLGDGHEVAKAAQVSEGQYGINASNQRLSGPSLAGKAIPFDRHPERSRP